MAKRTYKYEITGSIIVDETDLRTAMLGMPVQFETLDPTPDQYMQEATDWATWIQTAPPDVLISQALMHALEVFRVNVRPGRHPIPKIIVTPQND